MQSRCGRIESEEILPLADPDDDGDTGRETDDHRVRDEADHATELREAHRQQDEPGHQRRDLKPCDAILGRYAGKYGDERAGRSGNLHARAAEERGREPGDDGGIDALLRLGARGDRERHRQRQRDDPDDDAGDDIPPDLTAAEKAGAMSFK